MTESLAAGHALGDTLEAGQRSRPASRSTVHAEYKRRWMRAYRARKRAEKQGRIALQLEHWRTARTIPPCFSDAEWAEWTRWNDVLPPKMRAIPCGIDECVGGFSQKMTEIGCCRRTFP